MAKITTITNPLTGQPAQVDQLEHTAQEIDDAIARALPGGAIDTLLNGKAPAGYGLGKTAYSTKAGTLADIDTYVENGWWRFDAVGVYDAIGVSANHSVLRIDAGRTVVQTLFLSSHDAVVTRRKIATESAWGEWEWVNPPMQINVEYRTTEQYQGKPVYVKLVDFGALPNATTKSVKFSIENNNQLLECKGFIPGGSVLPYSFPGSSVGTANVYTNRGSGNFGVFVSIDKDMSGSIAYFILKYTKTTD